MPKKLAAIGTDPRELYDLRAFLCRLPMAAVRTLVLLDPRRIGNADASGRGDAFYLSSLVAAVNEAAIHYFLAWMRVADLKVFQRISNEALKDDLDIEVGKSGSVLRKRAKVVLELCGFTRLFGQILHREDALLARLCGRLGVPYLDRTSSIVLMVGTIHENGLLGYLSSFSTVDLHRILQSMSIDNPATFSRSALVQAIFSGVAPPAPSPTPPPPPSIRVEIAPGITKDTLLERYSARELRSFCTSHKIKAGGPKLDIIQRILTFLTITSIPPIVSTPHPAAKELILDLDQLDRYPSAILAGYCLEEGIVPIGYERPHLLRAIRQYNDEGPRTPQHFVELDHLTQYSAETLYEFCSLCNIPVERLSPEELMHGCIADYASALRSQLEIILERDEHTLSSYGP